MFFKRIFELLSNPEKEFKRLASLSLDDVVDEYLQRLWFFSIFYALAGSLVTLARAIYFNKFMGVAVNYLRVLNLAVTTAFATVFVYFLTGTFLVLVFTLVLKLIFKKTDYILLAKNTLISLTPVLAFGGAFEYSLLLFFWSAFIFWVGLNALPKFQQAKKRNDKLRRE